MKKHIKEYWKDEPKTVETYSRDDQKWVKERFLSLAGFS